MQLLYGNDGVNYRLIDKSPEMTEGIQESMLATYSKYEFVTNWREYSSVDKEPEAITFVTSNLDNQMPVDQLVICKTGHMRQFSSPSYYFHGLVENVSDDFFKKEFFQIFNYEFIRDIDVELYKDGNIHEYVFDKREMNSVALTNDQLIVILANFMSNEKKGKKTKIFVDACGDRYNSRSREILASIYHYLPYELRKRYGFKSYSRDEKNLPARVSFVLFNQNETSRTEEYITLTETVSDIQQTNDKKYIEYATFLVSMDDAERAQHFAQLSKLAKNGRLTISECITYFSNMSRWSMGTQEALLPEWIQYVDQNSFRKGPLYELLLEIVIEKVDNQYYNDYLFNEILELYKENICNLSPTAAKAIRFADCLDEIYIEPARFHEWYQSKLKAKLNKLNVADPAYEINLQKFYETEIAALKAVDIMSAELTDLLKTEIEELSKKCFKLSSNIDDLKEKELETVGRKLAALDNVSIDVFAREVINVQKGIHFSESKNETLIAVSEWIDKNFPKKFKNEKELDIYYQSLMKLKAYLGEQKFETCSKLITSEYARFVAEKESKNVVFEKSQLLKEYVELMVGLEKEVLNSTDKIQVVFERGGSKKSVSAAELKKILEFVLNPSDDNCSILTVYAQTLLNANVLTAEHLNYLLSNTGLREANIENILNYYLKKPVQISGAYMASVIWKKHSEKTKTFVKMYEEEDGEAGRFAETLKGFLRANAKNSQNTKERQEESSKPKKAFNLFGGKR